LVGRPGQWYVSTVRMAYCKLSSLHPSVVNQLLSDRYLFASSLLLEEGAFNVGASNRFRAMVARWQNEPMRQQGVLGSDGLVRASGRCPDLLPQLFCCNGATTFESQRKARATMKIVNAEAIAELTCCRLAAQKDEP
jgi:hypothetical protein